MTASRANLDCPACDRLTKHVGQVESALVSRGEQPRTGARNRAGPQYGAIGTGRTTRCMSTGDADSGPSGLSLGRTSRDRNSQPRVTVQPRARRRREGPAVDDLHLLRARCNAILAQVREERCKAWNGKHANSRHERCLRRIQPWHGNCGEPCA